ncbi:MAG: hypothetical protein ACXADA_07925 [Candidatus Hodarchaeales archaeon]|jgi:hypothetical protein
MMMKAREIGKYLIIIGTVLMFVVAIVFILNAINILTGDFAGGFLTMVGSVLGIIEIDALLHGVIMIGTGILSVIMIQHYNFERSTNTHIWWGLAWVIMGFIGGGWGGLAMIFGGAFLVADPLL